MITENKIFKKFNYHFSKRLNYSEDSELKKVLIKRPWRIHQVVKWQRSNHINILQESEFNDFFKNKNLEILTIYPSIGYEQDLLNMISRKFGVTFNFIWWIWHGLLALR